MFSPMVDEQKMQQMNARLREALTAHRVADVLDVLDLMQHSQVTSLDLSGQTIDEGAMSVLAEALSIKLNSPEGFRITQLNFAQAAMSSPQMLLELIRSHCAQLTDIDFSGAVHHSPAGNGQLSTEHLNLIVDIALNCRDLKRLGLSCVREEGDGGRPLSRLLESPPFQLQALHLSSSSSEDVGLLASCLAPGGHLEGLEALEFDLASPVPEGDICARFLTALNANRSLRAANVPLPVLKWYVNALREDEPMAKGIRWTHPCLEKLEPFHNQVRGGQPGAPMTAISRQVLDSLARAQAQHRDSKTALALCIRERRLIPDLVNRTLSVFDVSYVADVPEIVWPHEVVRDARSQEVTSEESTFDDTDSDEVTSPEGTPSGSSSSSKD